MHQELEKDTRCQGIRAVNPVFLKTSSTLPSGQLHSTIKSLLWLKQD